MNNLIIPSLYSLMDDQPDSRQLAIKINFLYKNAVFDSDWKLFSKNVIDSVDLSNVPILSSDGEAIGVIPETASRDWTLLYVDGNWRSYLQVEGVLWTKFSEKIPYLDENATDYYKMEAELSNIDGEQDGDYFAVSSFSVENLRLVENPQANSTNYSRYGNLPTK